ncbi:MAG: DegV family protein [Lachnospiraceae bacterium]|nr:DegV family protein [Lachnospiraceae bacterium]
MIKVIVDSTADLTDEVRKRVSVVPLTVRFGDVEYIDKVTIDNKTFYEKLIEDDVIPTTSQATPIMFEDEYDKIAPGDEAIVITLSSKLSGTYQSACIAVGDREGIYVVDSDNVTVGTSILVEEAFNLIDAGLSAKEIAAKLEEDKERILVIALLDTLEYLKKGGRISPAVAFIGGILNVKPVINIEHGVINVLGKARGSKHGNNLLVEEIQKSGGVDFDMPVLLGYTGLTDNLLLKYIDDSKPLWDNSSEGLRYTSIGSVIGTHAGPGAIAVAFFKKNA